jgi:tRNA threonylcarbamoyladenosine biosynthesis protein TsaB
MLTLAFDTATSVTTVAVLDELHVVGECVSTTDRLLADADGLLRAYGAAAEQLDRIVVGTGPGSFTGIRIGLAAARSLSFSLSIPVAGVSTLAALAAGAPGAVPVIDAKRRELFVLRAGDAQCVAAEAFDPVPGQAYVGDGARRYRSLLERRGAEVPADDSPLHVPSARHHALLAEEFGPPEAVEPLYLRVPDAEARATA